MSDHGRPIKVDWIARWKGYHCYLWRVETSGTHIFKVNSDYVKVSTYVGMVECELILELKILEEVGSKDEEAKTVEEVHPVIVSPFESIDSKDEEAILALPMQERNAALLNNPFMSDIAFKVGPEGQEVKFFGHKFLLSMPSKVFRAMLMPECPESKVSKIIDIPDVHPTAFMTLLRFIYRNETIVEKELIRETIFVDERYRVKGFLKSMEKCLDSETVMEFLPFVARVEPTHVLYEKCLALVKRHLDVKKEAFLRLEAQVLQSILKCDDIKVKKVDLFYAYVKWADK